MKKLQNRKGFTLVELLIVMAIIGILLLVAVPRFSRSTESATVRTAQANVRILVSAAQTYFADRSAWPVTGADGIKALVDGGYVGSDTFGANGSGNTKPKDTVYIVDNNKMKATVSNISKDPGIDGVTHSGTTAVIEMPFK